MASTRATELQRNHCEHSTIRRFGNDSEVGEQHCDQISQPYLSTESPYVTVSRTN